MTTVTDPLTAAEIDLWTKRFSAIPQYCGNEISPGGREGPWTDKETTPDQSRIEDYIERLCRPEDSILHVGIGNSLLAGRFGAHVFQIVGITTEPDEFDHARELEIPNYTPLLVNKFTLEFSQRWPSKFRFIVDNNPTSYACCFLHLRRMMRAYSRMLRPAGQIVTDREGLRYTEDQTNPRFGFDFNDWSDAAEMSGLKARDVDGSIYVTAFA